MLWKLSSLWPVLFVVNHAEVSPERGPEKGSHSPEWRCPFNIGNSYKDYMFIFQGQSLCPLIRGVSWIEVSQKERCILNKEIYVQNDNRDLLSLSFYEELNCQSVPAPRNGVLDCEKEGNSQAVRCQLKCNQGYDVTYLAAEYYVCNEDGSWSAEPSSAGTQWPDCKIYRLV